MRIEIFVVRSPKENLRRLGILNERLLRLFGGCTIIPNCCGSWIDKRGSKIDDKVEIWLIYAPKSKANKHMELKSILRDIKDATCQQTQCYALNNEMGFV